MGRRRGPEFKGCPHAASTKLTIKQFWAGSRYGPGCPTFRRAAVDNITDQAGPDQGGHPGQGPERPERAVGKLTDQAVLGRIALVGRDIRPSVTLRLKS